MGRYQADEHVPYFCTMTVLDWIPLFIDARYTDPVIESLCYCRRRKGLSVFGFVIMPNHMHMVAGAPDLPAVVRDFKRFTSRTIRDRLKADGRTTIFRWLEWATEKARRERGKRRCGVPDFIPKQFTHAPCSIRNCDTCMRIPCGKG